MEQLTYRAKTSNFINEFKIKLSRHSFKKIFSTRPPWKAVFILLRLLFFFIVVER